MLSPMYIRRTTIKSRKDGKPYYTYRLVESVRTQKGVRQRTLLNLGRGFSYPRETWPDLAARIGEILHGQSRLIPLSADLETAAQKYAALMIQAQARADEFRKEEEKQDYHIVDIDSLEVQRPRSIGAEHVAYEVFKQLELDSKLTELGFNRHQLNAAIGTVIGRMINPGSELSTHDWLQNHSGLGELTGYDYGSMALVRMYQVSDLLLKHKGAIERHLYNRERSLFEFKETITLYDLTNTYFEGSGKANDNAAYGRSKEKRSDCPLVTLGLVLDSSGFPKKSKVFTGNASEPETLEEMIKGLRETFDTPEDGQQGLFKAEDPTIVMDAGIATEDNIKWLKAHHYHYLVVSRKRHREFCQDEAIIVKQDKSCTVKAQKVYNEETGEVELYCHSTLREEKDRGIYDRFSARFEEDLEKLNAGLHKKGCVKRYDKVLERLGRIKQKYSRAAKNYEVTVHRDEQTGYAARIDWKQKQVLASADSYPGVYCLRSDRDSWDESTLWQTYTMLTDLESVFRCLKSELGLRPVFHQKTDRVSGHLFISLLGYHLIHTIRYQLKKRDIHARWGRLRRQLGGQTRVTVQMKCQNGDVIHIRKSTRPEPRQQVIYDALNLPYYPGKTTKVIL